MEKRAEKGSSTWPILSTYLKRVTQMDGRATSKRSLKPPRHFRARYSPRKTLPNPLPYRKYPAISKANWCAQNVKRHFQPPVFPTFAIFKSFVVKNFHHCRGKGKRKEEKIGASMDASSSSFEPDYSRNKEKQSREKVKKEDGGREEWKANPPPVTTHTLLE